MSDEKSAHTDEVAPTAETEGDAGPLRDADRVIAAFGGIRPMASQLGIAATTIQGWKSRGHIPEGRRQAVLDAAAAAGVDLTAAPPAGEPDPSETDTETVAEVAETPTEQPPVVAKGGNRLAWFAIVLAGVALFTVLTQPKWAPILYKTQPSAAAANIDAIESRLGALERRRVAPDLSNRLADAEQRLAELRARAPVALPADPGPRLEALSARLEALARELDKAGAVRTGDASELESLRLAVAGLSEKVEQAVVDTAASTARKSAVLIAVGALEVALDDGTPYAPALDAVKQAAPDDPAVKAAIGALEAHAGRGVPTRAQLARRIDTLAANRGAPLWQSEGDGWTDKVLRKIDSVVSIRKLDKNAVDGGRIERAKRALAEKDLPGAVAALEGATGAAAQWVGDARARMTADQALTKLRLWAIATLDSPATTK